MSSQDLSYLSTSAATTPQNYPAHQIGKTKLRKLLRATQNPTTTISQFQRDHSLHSYLAKSFSTLPNHSNGSKGGKNSGRATTRNDVENKKSNEKIGVMVETFQPESVFNFCGHCNVSRYEMHKTIADALRSSLEEEIKKVDLKATFGKESLLELLKNSWQFINVPELRGVFVTLMKKLGDETPEEVLVLLASKGPANTKDTKKLSATTTTVTANVSGEGGILKYGDLLNSFGLDMKRLVWEADWNKTIRGDGIPLDKSVSDNVGTLKGDNIFTDMVRPAIYNYLQNEELQKAADLAYTGSIREKRIDTQKRRTSTGNLDRLSSNSSSSNASSAGMSLSALTSTKTAEKTAVNGEDKNKEKNLAPKAMTELKEVMGLRPKLLSATLNILIAEHGQFASNDTKRSRPMQLVSGSKFLHCSLLTDVLLSYGQLPRQYEVVRLLAQTLDNCAKIGMISDQSIGQIQACLKTIFQPDQDVIATDSKKRQQTATSTKNEKQIKPPAQKKGKSSNQVKNDDSQFELKLLRKIIKASLAAMRESDPQGLFLNPVTDEIAPGYSKVIKRPMCVRVVEEKAINLRYASLSQYETDVQLMFQNCIAYNIGKDGQWFRGEARRQQKKFRDNKSDASNLYKQEMGKRKKQLENASTSGNSAPTIDKKTMEENKRKEILLAQQRHLSKIGAKAIGEKRKVDAIHGESGNDNSTKVIQPLSASRAKRRKKDTSYPSIPALASMILSDPFVVRLLLDKVLRAVRNDLMKDKNIPAEHHSVPSVLQILHIASLSTKLCAQKGKKFVVPDVGMILKSKDENEDTEIQDIESFTMLREQTPLLAKLLLEAEIDKRTNIGGDLQVLPALPKSSELQWKDIDKSSLRLLLDLVEGSLIHLLQPGVSNEKALLSQCPRFFIAIRELSNGNMVDEHCFFTSLSHVLLRYKLKLPHSVRDLFVSEWLNWFKTSKNCMTGAVHLCFITLLNEWASLGNVLLPIDTMISWSEDAVNAAESDIDSAETVTFRSLWEGDDQKFQKIKSQYSRMLKIIPADRATTWKEAVGI